MIIFRLLQRGLVFLEIEPGLRRMLAENRAALPLQKHCLWDRKQWRSQAHPEDQDEEKN